MSAEQAKRKWSRRRFLTVSAGAGAVLAGGALAAGRWLTREGEAEVFIARAQSYSQELSSLVRRGLAELGLGPAQVRGKRILLKPNMVETDPGTVHVCTHPAVVKAAAQAFLGLGAGRVLIGEGTGHCRDVHRALDQAGMSRIVHPSRLPFVDLNRDDLYTVPNRGRYSKLKTLTFPATLRRVDWVVSLAKLKTHHWAGVTLAMKNLFGLMPGMVYGWPKNVLHHAGLMGSILDINATFRPQLAIVDGIVGMEGDGPIMGRPKMAGVLVMGRNLPAVDATCTRIMGLDPRRVPYLQAASGWLGPIGQGNINQRGEPIAAVRTPFRLEDHIPIHRTLRA